VDSDANYSNEALKAIYEGRDAKIDDEELTTNEQKKLLT